MTHSDLNVVVATFSEEEVRRLTGISLRQLRYWDSTSFFSPSFISEDRSVRLYSFRDLVCLQVLNSIRNVAKVPLPHLREVKEKLAHLGDDLWAKTTLYVLKKRVVFVNPQTNDKEEVLTGQKALPIPLEIFRSDMLRAVNRDRERKMTDIGKIHKTRGVVRNKAVVAGTRVQVSSIKAFHDAGYSTSRIIEEYPSLTEQDIEAAIAHSATAAA